MPKILVFTCLSLLFLCSHAYAETITLGDCLKRAESANPELKVAAYDAQIAKDNIDIARSGYLPSLDFQGGYTAQQAPQSVMIQNFQAPTQQADYGFFSASLDQTIYDFGRTSARYERAKTLTEATSYNYTARTKDVFLQVVEAYYGVLESRKILRSAEEDVLQMTDHLRVAQNLYEQGAVTRNDLLQAEVQLADSNQRRLAAANSVENSWLYLNYLTGRLPVYRADLEDDNSLPSLPPHGDVQAELSNRPEIKAQKKAIEAAELSVKESRSGYFPEIFARLGVDYVENDKVKEQAIMSATAGLRINLFDGLATTSRYRQSVKTLHRNSQNLLQMEAGIRLEYETAWNDAKVADERIATVSKAISQGEENLRINKDRYLEQVGTATDVIDAQTLLTRTKTEYYRAVFDYEVALARVRKALGQL
jgi:outer membrane protein